MSASGIILPDANPYKMYDNGIIILKASEYMGAARGTLTTTSDALSLTGTVVVDTQFTTEDTNYGGVSPDPRNDAWPDMDNTIVIDPTTLPFTDYEFYDQNSWAVFLSCRKLGPSLDQYTKFETFRDADKYSAVVACNNPIAGFDDIALYPNISNGDWQGGLGSHYYPYYKLILMDSGIPHYADADFRIKIWQLGDTTDGIAIDHIILIPITGPEWFFFENDDPDWGTYSPEIIEAVKNFVDERQETGTIDPVSVIGLSIGTRDEDYLEIAWDCDYQKADTFQDSPDVEHFPAYIALAGSGDLIGARLGVVGAVVAHQIDEIDLGSDDFSRTNNNSPVGNSVTGWGISSDVERNWHGVIFSNHYGGTDGSSGLHAPATGHMGVATAYGIGYLPSLSFTTQTRASLRGCWSQDARISVTLDNTPSNSPCDHLAFGLLCPQVFGSYSDFLFAACQLEYTSTSTLKARLIVRHKDIIDAPSASSGFDTTKDYTIDGPVTITTSYAPTTDEIHFRVQKELYYIRAKVWLNSDSEPSSWTLEGYLPGAQYKDATTTFSWIDHPYEFDNDLDALTDTDYTPLEDVAYALSHPFCKTQAGTNSQTSSTITAHWTDFSTKYTQYGTEPGDGAIKIQNRDNNEIIVDTTFPYGSEVIYYGKPKSNYDLEYFDVYLISETASPVLQCIAVKPFWDTFSSIPKTYLSRSRYRAYQSA